MFSISPFREGSWVIFFVFMGFMTFSLLRPLPVIVPNIPMHTVLDGDNTPVQMPLAVKGIVGWGSFLPMTHRPDLLYKGGGELGRKIFSMYIISWIYPDVLNDNAVWGTPYNLEALLAYDDDIVVINNVYFGGMAFGSDDLQRLGIHAIETSSKIENDDEYLKSNVRVMNTLVKQPQFTHTVLDRYFQGFLTLEHDLQPQKITDRPNVIGVGAPSNNWARLFVIRIDEVKQNQLALSSPTKQELASGRQQDPERILSIDPDIIMLLGTERRDFMSDPRWQGLKAVQTNKVYENSMKISGSRYDIDNLPIGARWMAEITHPEIMRPKLRETITKYYSDAYGYTLSDTQLDDILLIDKNKDASGYKRFMRQGGSCEAK